MNFRLTSIAFWLLTAITFSGCYVDFDDDDFCRKGSGGIISENRMLAPFSQITNYTSSQIIIEQGSVYKVIVETHRNIIEEVSTDVQGSTLLIDTDRCLNADYINITIVVPTVSSVQNFGSGNIYSTDIWKSEEVDLHLSGSGSMKMNVDCEQLNLNLYGSGTYTILGNAHHAKSSTSGSGIIHAFGLNTEYFEAIILGSGSTETFVNSSLTGRINGSGYIYYKGHPDTIDVDIEGSGAIIDRN